MHSSLTHMMNWNSHVSHPMQSWEWGEVRRSEGKQVVRFHDHPAHGPHLWMADHHLSPEDMVYQMTLHPIPYTSSSIGYIPKSGVPSKAFLHYLKDYARKHKIVFVKFEPDILDTDNGKWEIGDLLRKSPHPLFTDWNQVLDISKSEEDLLATMHPKTRYNIRLAAKKGVTVREMSDAEGYAIFEQLYFETCKRQGYHGHTPAYHQNIWKHLQPKYPISNIQSSNSDPSPISSTNEGPPPTQVSIPNSELTSHILISWYEGTPLGAFQLWHFKDTMYYVYGGSNIEHKSVMAPNLLMWEAIRLAKSLGCTRFDMWGSLPPEHDSKDPWAGFTRFKSGYGTQFVRTVGSYDLPASSNLYALYTIAQNLRSRMI